MKVLGLEVLAEFARTHAEVRTQLQVWLAEAEEAQWKGPDDIQRRYPTASFLAGNRVVFNVGGNKYRLVVEVQYQAGIVWVKFIGTHAQYDRINVETVNDY